MPNFNLTLSEDTTNILAAISEQLGLVSGVTLEERLEFAIDAIANSIDTGMEVATSDEGTPVQMQEAVNAILNPHIGTTYEAPAGNTPQNNSITWEDVESELGTTTIHSDIDSITKEAMIIVFNELPRDEWSSEHAERLIDQTIALLRHRKGAGEEV